MNTAGKWTDIFFGKLQTLLGERSPRADAAVRFRDLGEVYNSAAVRAGTIAETITVAAVSTALVDVSISFRHASNQVARRSRVAASEPVSSRAKR